MRAPIPAASSTAAETAAMFRLVGEPSAAERGDGDSVMPPYQAACGTEASSVVADDSEKGASFSQAEVGGSDQTPSGWFAGSRIGVDLTFVTSSAMRLDKGDHVLSRR
jgi:hypothetical protein